jgi:hypothetical protein
MYILSLHTNLTSQAEATTKWPKAKGKPEFGFFPTGAKDAAYASPFVQERFLK